MEIHSQLHPIAQGQRTTAIVRVMDKFGNVIDLVSSSEISLSKAQRLFLVQPCEVPVKGMPGSIGIHAEQRALEYARFMGYQPLEGAASRPICPGCAQQMFNAGAVPVSPLE
jgi:hypothetical protein